MALTRLARAVKTEIHWLKGSLALSSAVAQWNIVTSKLRDYQRGCSEAEGLLYWVGDAVTIKPGQRIPSST
jgi:hypothetical protein